MRKYKYIVVSPRIDNGGCLVLHTLYKYLQDLGKDVKIFYFGNNIYDEKHRVSFWFQWLLTQFKVSIKNLVVKVIGNRIPRCSIHIPKCKYRRKYLPFFDDDTIVIYSEKVFGNPFKAKNVVRWFLLYNSLYSQKDGKPVGYDKNDLFFTYRDVFNDKSINPSCRKLHLAYFDLDLYKRTNYGERSGNCYILRKGAWRPDLPKEFDGPIIDNLPEEKKVETFNKCKYCISYDTQTSYSNIAALCGCISIVVPEKGKTWRDYRTEEEYKSDFGIAFGFDDEEIDKAVDNMDRVVEYFEKINQVGLNNVKDFVDECEDYFSQQL